LLQIKLNWLGRLWRREEWGRGPRGFRTGGKDGEGAEGGDAGKVISQVTQVDFGFGREDFGEAFNVFWGDVATGTDFMLVSKGTVNSISTTFLEGNTRTISGRWEVQRTLGGMVVPAGERQPGRSAKMSGGEGRDE